MHTLKWLDCFALRSSDMHMLQKDNGFGTGLAQASLTAEDRPRRSRRRCPDRLDFGDLEWSSLRAVRRLSGNRRACRQFVTLVASQTDYWLRKVTCKASDGDLPSQRSP